MADFSPDLGPQILAACQAAQADIAGSLGSALGNTLTVEFAAEPRPASEFAAALTGPGLLIEFRTSTGAAGLILPESTGLLPDWYRAPDPTGASKLATLAQELSLQALPESCQADDFAARAVADLQAELSATFAREGTTGLRWTLKSADRSGEVLLLWPLMPAAAPAPPPVQPKPAPAPKTTQATPAQHKPVASAANPTAPARRAKQVEDLPVFARSLLRVRVPVCVKLAERKQPVSRILEIAPGAILQFDKSCHEMLDLQVGDRSIAQGEAVKVGDKFGLRIANVILPEEQFRPVRKR